MNQQLIYKRHPWVYSLRIRLVISISLSLLVIFILIFLEPFDTGEKKLPRKNLMLAGYGICLLLADLLLLFLERLWVMKLKRSWFSSLEALYHILLFLITSVLIYSYDLIITKQSTLSWDYLFQFSLNFIVPFAILLLPALAFLRYQNGKIISPNELDNPMIQLIGQNKEDSLKIHLYQLICIKAEDNYTRIIFKGEHGQVQEVLMRSTLSKMAKQTAHLKYCHRSYLVAPWHIKQIIGNKQKACIQLKDYDKEIPLSTAYYSTIYNLMRP